RVDLKTARIRSLSWLSRGFAVRDRHLLLPARGRASRKLRAGVRAWGRAGARADRHRSITAVAEEAEGLSSRQPSSGVHSSTVGPFLNGQSAREWCSTPAASSSA